MPARRYDGLVRPDDSDASNGVVAARALPLVVLGVRHKQEVASEEWPD